MRRVRVVAACDRCKLRKIKCDGSQPCSHCQQRNNVVCRYTLAKSHRPRTSARPQTEAPFIGVIDLNDNRDSSNAPSVEVGPRQSEPHNDDEDTDVPLQARLLQDDYGKFSFIGDCAPLSFLQTVRHLVALYVDQNAFNNQLGRDPMLEQVDPWDTTQPQSTRLVFPEEVVEGAICTFLTVTSGIIDSDDAYGLCQSGRQWASVEPKPSDVGSSIQYLVFAIGLQCSDEVTASHCFHMGRNIALSNMTASTSPAIAQAFLLIAFFMLRACQANGSFLYFGLAARAAYSIGMHRTQVNARFGKDAQRSRERLYKSLKTFDTFISVVLGRPPALYDLDCTVPYRESAMDASKETDCLDDTLQILSIAEVVVMEVYSRRKISLQLTTTISQQLKGWALQRVPRLMHVVSTPTSINLPLVVGACQALSTYYFTIMLLTKPFLMYEVHRKMSEMQSRSAIQDQQRANKGRTRLAESCIDAACSMVDLISRVQSNESMPHKMPFIVPWLLTAALALGVGLLGGFGRVLEKYLIEAITALEYFASHDAQALQYSLISKSLLSTTLECLQRNEMMERRAKGKHSMDLFGLIPSSFQQKSTTTPPMLPDPSTVTSGLDEIDFSTFGDALEGDSADFFGDLNLFPMFEANGDFDFANIT